MLRVRIIISFSNYLFSVDLKIFKQILVLSYEKDMDVLTSKASFPITPLFSDASQLKFAFLLV